MPLNITMDTPLGQMLQHPNAMAVLEQYFPGISANPMFLMAKDMNMKMILAMPQAAGLGITKEKVELILAEINKRA